MSWLVRALTLAALTAVLTACGSQTEALPPLGQLLLFVDTDAPLPAAPGASPDPTQPPPLFDRLCVDVGRSGKLESEPVTEREFVVHRGLFTGGPLSIGIAPPTGEMGYAARLRLYRSADAVDGVAAPSSSIDATIALPAVADEGITRLMVELHVDDTGRTGLKPTPRSLRDAPASSTVGSWPGAEPTPCPGPAGADEACVPGGAFWMGDPELRNDPDVQDAEREHLVVVSPFFIDTHEVTVAALRERQAELDAAGVPLPPLWSGSDEGSTEDDYSTFTLGASPADPDDAKAALPVNGVSWQTARAYCQALGKDLPSEAMFEFLASGRGLEQKYAWGDDAPECADAVSGRAGFGVYATFDGACRSGSDPGGVLPVGSGRRDRVELTSELGSVAVLDLAGNLSEWTLDWFNAEDEAPWQAPGVMKDPVAGEMGRSGERRTVRGGSWRGSYVELRAASRVDREPDGVNRALGFRCARRP